MGRHFPLLLFVQKKKQKTQSSHKQVSQLQPSLSVSHWTPRYKASRQPLVWTFFHALRLCKISKLLSNFSELRNHRPSKIGWAVTSYYCCLYKKKNKKLKALISKCPSSSHLSLSLIGHHDLKHQDNHWSEPNHHHSLVRMRKIRAQESLRHVG